MACGIAAASAIARGPSPRGIAACPQVPGRMERVGTGRSREAPTVLVDYAHTPDAVEKLLRTLRPLSRGSADRGLRLRRRPRPRQAAADGRGGGAPRDRAIVATSDNPRTEDPDAILRRRRGRTGEAHARRLPTPWTQARRAYVRSRPPRRPSTSPSRIAARPDDTVVIAGKGHEDYQIVGRERSSPSTTATRRGARSARGRRMSVPFSADASGALVDRGTLLQGESADTRFDRRSPSTPAQTWQWG